MFKPTSHLIYSRVLPVFLLSTISLPRWRLKPVCVSLAFGVFSLSLMSGSPAQAAQGTPFRDCDVCPQMTTIPAGRLVMGSLPPGSPSLREDEKDLDIGFEESPRHDVSIPAFALGTHEVTQREWQAVMGYNPSVQQGDNLPVDSISWEEAKAYIDKLRQLSGKDYRLPTEAEWEYAARAGSDATFPAGVDLSSLDEFAWHRNNANERSHPVGTRKPNAFGLYDMLGNVWERTEDCWIPHYEEAPANGTARLDGDCDFRVVRGGSWVNWPRFLRPAYRFRYNTTSRYEFVGLRVARGLDQR